MSIQHLFSPNSYDLNCDTLTVNTLNIDNLTIDNLTITNDLTVTNDSNLNNLTIATNTDVTNVNITGTLNLPAPSTPLSVYQTGTYQATISNLSCATQVTLRDASVVNHLPLKYTIVGNMVTISWDQFSFTATNTNNFILDPFPAELQTIELYDEISSNVTPNGQPIAYETLIWHQVDNTNIVTISNLDDAEGTTANALYLVLSGSISFINNN